MIKPAGEGDVALGVECALPAAYPRGSGLAHGDGPLARGAKAALRAVRRLNTRTRLRQQRR